MSSVNTDHLASLGSEKTEYKFKGHDASLLETFASPFADPEQNPSGAQGEIKITCPEFTSLCPKTGQPDFATIVIQYTPNELCVESKSLKLYLNTYRNEGEFHEACVNRITNDLVKLLNPAYLRVEGQFTPRGGIPFWPVSTYFG